MSLDEECEPGKWRFSISEWIANITDANEARLLRRRQVENLIAPVTEDSASIESDRQERREPSNNSSQVVSAKRAKA